MAERYLLGIYIFPSLSYRKIATPAPFPPPRAPHAKDGQQPLGRPGPEPGGEEESSSKEAAPRVPSGRLRSPLVPSKAGGSLLLSVGPEGRSVSAEGKQTKKREWPNLVYLSWPGG